MVLVSARSHFYDRNDGGLWRGGLAPSSASSGTGLDWAPIFEMAVWP